MVIQLTLGSHDFFFTILGMIFFCFIELYIFPQFEKRTHFKLTEILYVLVDQKYTLERAILRD